MATMTDLDGLALALPLTEKTVFEDGRPPYSVKGRLYCLHRSRRPDAVDPETGERPDDNFDGYPAVLLRIPDLQRIDREELRDLLVEACLTRAPKRVARAWLEENEPAADG